MVKESKVSFKEKLKSLQSIYDWYSECIVSVANLRFSAREEGWSIVGKSRLQ
jgi:hypothetical protein